MTDRRILTLLVLLGVASCARAPHPATVPLAATIGSDLKVANGNGVALHYVERGSGEPVILVHGGLVDYREWGGVMQDLAVDHRVIAYSRRYNYPNTNTRTNGFHSATVEAEDLAAFIREAVGGPVHLGGVSFGALTALLLAVDHPTLVRTLTLVEPPLMDWLPDLPGGAVEYDRMRNELLAPAARAFRAGDRDQALRSSLDYFLGPGSMDQLPPEVVAMLRSNLMEWEAITTSPIAFSRPSREEVKVLRMPVLMISGGRSYPSMHLTDAEFQRLLPHVKRLTVPEGTHDVCSEQPAACAAAIREHIARNAHLWRLH